MNARSAGDRADRSAASTSMEGAGGIFEGVEVVSDDQQEPVPNDKGWDIDASVKQVGAGVLNVGFAEMGSTDRPAVILLQGWPCDIHSYADVASLLASAGYRVIVPHLRGYGTTRFLSHDTIQVAGW